jgi:hypothetical protein
MLPNIKQHFKIVDNFLELPGMWRTFALQQEYIKDHSGYPGKKTKTLDELNAGMFHSLAEKIVLHVNGKTNFQRLKIQFTCTNLNEFSNNERHQDEPFYNVAGLIYLNENAPANTGTVFFNKTARGEQVETITVENAYNRMIIFDPAWWHSPAGTFGDDLESSRLTITFFGIAT